MADFWSVVGRPSSPPSRSSTVTTTTTLVSTRTAEDANSYYVPRVHPTHRSAYATSAPQSTIGNPSQPDTQNRLHFSSNHPQLPYDNDRYHDGRGHQLLSPPRVQPASPETSVAAYRQNIPYPDPHNLPGSHANFHPTLFGDANPGPPVNRDVYVYPIQRRPLGSYFEEYQRELEHHPMPGRARAPSPEERAPPPRQPEQATVAPSRQAENDRAGKGSASEPANWDDEQWQDFFDFIAGRQVPRRPCVYGLPIDPEEHARLDIGHTMIIQALKELFVGPVEEVLRNVPGQVKRILDIGTGNGTWAKDMARRFEHTLIDVIDLLPPKKADLPRNIEPYRADVTRGLRFPEGRYDFVHARNIQLGIPQYPELIDECARVLKNGGLVNLIEGDWDVFDADGNPVTLYKNPGWFNWIQAWRGAVMAKNIDLQAPQKTEQWLKDSPYFTEVRTLAKWMPVGPWTNDSSMNELGIHVWENLKYLIPSIRPLLTEYYYGDQSVADRIVQHCWAELASPHSHVFMRWRFFSAKRNARGYNSPAPRPLPGRRPRKGKPSDRSGPAPSQGEASRSRA